MKKTYCWNCKAYGSNIAPNGICTRCETNLVKHPKRITYPKELYDNEALAKEVLGYREKCDIRPNNKLVTQCNGQRSELNKETLVFDSPDSNTLNLTNQYCNHKDKINLKAKYEGWNYYDKIK